MDHKLEQKLLDSYPKLFTPDYRGCSVSNGWFNLLIELFDAIHNYPLDNDTYPVIILDIQSIYGELHIHYLGGDSIIHHLVAHAMYMSRNTCEICGKPGMATSKTWIMTLCKEHRTHDA